MLGGSGGTHQPIRPEVSDGQGRRLDSLPTFTSARLLLVSFLILIAVCTTGLMVLPGLYTGTRLGFVDALFTATSAVCVTGLIVVDTATYFTIWGQLWLLLFIQLGGLGLLTFATIILASLGRRISLRTQGVFSTSVRTAGPLDVRRLVRDIVVFSLSLEAVAAAALFLLWARDLGPSEAFRHSIFQAVSAFCNAGFSTFSDSLVGFRESPATLTLVMLLIVTGGIGFLTVEELGSWLRSRTKAVRHRLSVHSRVVLVTTAVLIAGGALMMIALEWSGVLGELSWTDRLVNGLFMSVTSRTAGFNTIAHEAASDGTNFLTALLMFVGGSPGSTAGGIKTTTVALLALLAFSRLRGREAVSVAGRTVPPDTIQRAVGLVTLAAITLAAAILLLTLTEAAAGFGNRFLLITFEAFSAFNTVGLSMGITDDLSTPGRCVLIVLMYVGRVGPLTAAAALSRSRLIRSTSFRYAYEDVEIG